MRLAFKLLNRPLNSPIKCDHFGPTATNHHSLFGTGRIGSLSRMTRVQRLLGGTTIHIYVVVGPGGDVAERWGAAFSQGGNLCWLQHPIPQVELGQLPHQSLRGIKPPSQCILRLEEKEKQRVGCQIMWPWTARLGIMGLLLGLGFV